MTPSNSPMARADSSIPWLGDISPRWRTIRLKFALTLSSETNGKQPVGEMLSVSGYRGVEPKEYDHEARKRSAEELESYRVVHPGQLVVNTMWLNHAGLGVSRYEGHVSPAYRAYWVGSDFDSRFLHYLVRSQVYVAHYKSLLYGIRPNSYQVKTSDFDSIELLCPPRNTQRTIANFLDRKTAQIDALLEEKQRLLELLEEKRTALITQAVTKGLDPDVEMKDSGVEWLGEVPAHWAVVRLRHVIDEIEQGWSPSCENREATADEWGVLKTGCVNYGRFDPSEHKALPADEEPRPELEVKLGDVLMSRASGSPDLIGSVAMVVATRDRLLLSDKLYRLRYRRKQVHPGYLAQVLGAQPTRSQIRLSISGAGGLANNLAQADVQDYWIPLPPVDEQVTIHEFLGQIEADTHELTMACRVAINHLHEYRTALISAAVTGKIDVREAAA